jgi:hypothetical protein
VRIGIANDERNDGKVHPLRCVGIKGAQRDEKRQRPELHGHRRKHAAVDDFRQVCGCKEPDDANDVGGDAQERGMCRIEAQVAQGKRQVDRRRAGGNCNRLISSSALRLHK